jgi:rubredoxin
MADKCLVTINTALLLREFVKRESIRKPFLCKSCGREVKPLEEGRAKDSGRIAPAHFEHLKRNIDCPLSEKSKAKQLWAAELKRRAAKKKRGAKK